MAIKDYYIKELNSLRVEGAEFAKKNPGLSSYLSKEGQDPDVERMLEGFAFLTGKLQQRFDEELPEVAHNLVQLLWPNYIRPIPSATIVQFDSIKGGVKNQVVSKQTSLMSKNNINDVVCKFKTCFETKVMPLALESLEYISLGHKGALELDFTMSAPGSLVDVNFEPLRLFLSGSKFMSKELYLHLDRYVEKIEVFIKDDEQREIASLLLPTKSIRAVGFNAGETIVPYPRNVFDGYILLQEFFSFPEKHLFLDVLNLQNIENISGDVLKNAKDFSLKISFSKPLSTAQKPSIADFQMHCSPAINLFESDAVPIRKTASQDEYLVVSIECKKEESEVFAIENVRGWIPSKNTYQNFYPFESFKHIDEQGEYYSQRVKLNDSHDRVDTFLRFSSPENDFKGLDHNNAIVSVKMLCTNKNVPSTLQLGDICIKDPLSSSSLDFKNITTASVSYPPPIGGDFLWKVISNMSLNYLSLDNIKTLKVILQTYDFLGEHDLKQKEKTDTILSGLKSVSNKRTQIIFEGMPIRGVETELHIDPTKFTGIGEAYLLCCVLNEFFALYCNINSFHRLVVHMENAETFTWDPKIGSQALI